MSDLTFRLQLPDSLKLIHPVFHVSLLEAAPTSKIAGRVQPPPPAVIAEDAVLFEVEEVLDSRLKRNKLEYLVKWTGYDSHEN